MIRDITFPEITSSQINVSLLADKLNEVIHFINAHTLEDEEVPAPPLSPALPPLDTLSLKPGVLQAKNGRFYISGKGFIKPENAYA